MWDLEKALDFIRNLQPKVMADGYYLALAGGVLNLGVSGNDLDLVMMPMRFDSCDGDSVVRKHFGTPNTVTQVPKGVHFAFEGVEVVVV